MSDIQMSNQEPEMPHQIHEQDLQEETAALLDSFDSSTNRFSLLRLSNLVPSSAPAATNNNNCTKCGCSGSNNNPMKRRCPSSHLNPTTAAADSLDESQPRPKKLFLESPAPPTPLDGFSKILLPFGSSDFGVPVLRRCVSDPCNPPAGQYPDPFSRSGSAVNLNPPNSPPLESLKMAGVNPVTPSSGKGSASASTLPPLPPTLRRSVSDLNPTPSPAKSYSRLSGSAEMGVDESPNSKRLRRMRDRLREMSQSWLDFMNEEQEEYEASEKENPTTKDESLAENEESVSVERVGECLIIHFRCPCGKGYQILLSGTSCYYKLM